MTTPNNVTLYRENQIVHFHPDLVERCNLVQARFGYVESLSQIERVGPGITFKFNNLPLPTISRLIMSRAWGGEFPEIIAQPEDIKPGFHFQWNSPYYRRRILEWKIIATSQDGIEAIPIYGMGDYVWEDQRDFLNTVVLSPSFQLSPSQRYEVPLREMEQLNKQRKQIALAKIQRTWDERQEFINPQTPKSPAVKEKQCPKAELLCVREAPPHPILKEELQRAAIRVVGSKYTAWPICPRHEITLQVRIVDHETVFQVALLECKAALRLSFWISEEIKKMKGASAK